MTPIILICLFATPYLEHKPMQVSLVDAKEIIADGETLPAELVKYHAGYHCEREFGEEATGAYLVNTPKIKSRIKFVEARMKQDAK